MEQQKSSANHNSSVEATVTICLVTKLLPLFGPSISSSQSCFQSAPISISIATKEQTYTCLLQGSVSIPISSAVETFATMTTTTLKEQAWQSGLVLLGESPEWNFEDWPPLEGGWRYRHATVVLDHPDTDSNDNNPKRQTVVVIGGRQQGLGTTTSVLELNLSESNKQWREGPPMNKMREGHASVVCNGGVYVMGGYTRYSSLDCIEQINVTDLLQPSSTSSSSKKSNWTTLTCRLSTGRSGCSAVAVQNRYIVVMGGYYNHRYFSSVDIIDTNNHIVTAGPSMNVPRQLCASAVIDHRIFVVGGCNEHGNLYSVEYLDDATPCYSDETKKETGSMFISFSPTWTTHSELRLSNARSPCAMVAVGSCLVVAGGWTNSTMEVLDTHRNRVWNLPPFTHNRHGCTMVTVANQVAVIGGWENPSCATLPLPDRNSWCFRRLCKQPSNGWYHSLEATGIRDAEISPYSTSTLTCKRARTNPCQNDRGNDVT